jgi:hypothetical protein
MSEIKVNKISPRAACGTVTLGDSGDTFTIPAGATITNAGTANGFGATGAVNWQTTIKTSGFTAVNGEGYFVDTNGGPITVNLPAGTAGDVVGFKDYRNTFDTSALTVTPNGSDTIGGNTNAILSTEGIAVTLVFIDSTRGWMVTDSGLQSDAPGALYVDAVGGNTTTTVGDFKVHAFTSPGTFTVNDAGNSGGSNTVCVMVVAGGGGGGNDDGGGGGAGGMVLATSQSITTGAKPIAVGGGGNGGIPGCATSGSDSTALTLTGKGGGRGGAGSNSPNPWGVSPGGSGGGGQTNAGDAGTATQPSQPGVSGSSGKGFAGGTGGSNPSSNQGGGGGGASETGNTDGQGYGGDGFNVAPTFGSSPQPFYIANTPGTGTSACGQFAGGGAGSGSCTAAKAGEGGGGVGSPPPNGSAGGNGATNSGGGGGGGAPGSGPGGNGGSGIVLIRYKFQN